MSYKNNYNDINTNSNKLNRINILNNMKNTTKNTQYRINILNNIKNNNKSTQNRINILNNIKNKNKLSGGMNIFEEVVGATKNLATDLTDTTVELAGNAVDKTRVFGDDTSNFVRGNIPDSHHFYDILNTCFQSVCNIFLNKKENININKLFSLFILIIVFDSIETDNNPQSDLLDFLKKLKNNKLDKRFNFDWFNKNTDQIESKEIINSLFKIKEVLDYDNNPEYGIDNDIFKGNFTQLSKNMLKLFPLKYLAKFKEDNTLNEKLIKENLTLYYYSDKIEIMDSITNIFEIFTTIFDKDKFKMDNIFNSLLILYNCVIEYIHLENYDICFKVDSHDEFFDKIKNLDISENESNFFESLEKKVEGLDKINDKFYFNINDDNNKFTYQFLTEHVPILYNLNRKSKSPQTISPDAINNSHNMFNILNIMLLDYEYDPYNIYTNYNEYDKTKNAYFINKETITKLFTEYDCDLEIDYRLIYNNFSDKNFSIIHMIHNLAWDTYYGYKKESELKTTISKNPDIQYVLDTKNDNFRLYTSGQTSTYPLPLSITSTHILPISDKSSISTIVSSKEKKYIPIKYNFALNKTFLETYFKLLKFISSKDTINSSKDEFIRLFNNTFNDKENNEHLKLNESDNKELQKYIENLYYFFNDKENNGYLTLDDSDKKKFLSYFKEIEDEDFTKFINFKDEKFSLDKCITIDEIISYKNKLTIEDLNIVKILKICTATYFLLQFRFFNNILSSILKLFQSLYNYTTKEDLKDLKADKKILCLSYNSLECMYKASAIGNALQRVNSFNVHNLQHRILPLVVIKSKLEKGRILGGLSIPKKSISGDSVLDLLQKIKQSTTPDKAIKLVKEALNCNHKINPITNLFLLTYFKSKAHFWLKKHKKLNDETSKVFDKLSTTQNEYEKLVKEYDVLKSKFEDLDKESNEKINSLTEGVNDVEPLFRNIEEQNSKLQLEIIELIEKQAQYEYEKTNNEAKIKRYGKIIEELRSHITSVEEDYKTIYQIIKDKIKEFKKAFVKVFDLFKNNQTKQIEDKSIIDLQLVIQTALMSYNLIKNGRIIQYGGDTDGGDTVKTRSEVDKLFLQTVFEHNSHRLANDFIFTLANSTDKCFMESQFYDTYYEKFKDCAEQYENKQRELEKLKDTLQDYENKLNEYENKLNEYEHLQNQLKLKDLETEKKNKELKEKINECNTVNSEKEIVLKDKEQLASDKEQLTKEIKNLKEELQELTNYKNECEENTTNHQQELDRLQEQINLITDGELNDKEKELLELQLNEIKCKQLTIKCKTQEEECKELKKLKENNEKEIEELKEKQKEIEELKELKEKEIKVLTTKLDEKVETCDKITQKNNENESELTEIKNKYITQEKECKELKELKETNEKKIEALTTKLEKKAGTCNENEEQLKNLKDINNELSMNNSKTLQEIDNLKHKIEELNIINNTLEKTNKQTLKEKEDECNTVNSEKEIVLKNTEQLASDKKQLTEEINNLKKELQKNNEINEQEKNDLKDKEDKLTKEKDDLKQEKDDLKKQIRSLKSQNNTCMLSQQTNSNEEKLKEALQKLEAFEHENKTKDRQLKDKEALLKIFENMSQVPDRTIWETFKQTFNQLEDTNTQEELIRKYLTDEKVPTDIQEKIMKEVLPKMEK